MSAHALSTALLLLCCLSLAACGDDAATGGGDSPRDVVQRMADASNSDSMVDVVPLLLPEQRAMMTYMVGVLGPSMMIGMESMGDGANAEHKANLAAKKSEWEAILSKHNVTLPDEKEGMSAAMGSGDPSEAAAKFHKLMGDVDHAAFLRDSLAFMKKHSDEKNAQGGMPKFSADDAKITEDGDAATVTVAGQSSPLKLVKKDGRWFVDLASMQ